MYFENCQEDEFLSVEFGMIRGVELHNLADIKELAMKNGWMNSHIVYVGDFTIDDHDDTFALFRDWETKRNYYFPL